MLGQDLLIYNFLFYFILNHEEWCKWYAAGHNVKYFQKESYVCLSCIRKTGKTGTKKSDIKIDTLPAFGDFDIYSAHTSIWTKWLFFFRFGVMVWFYFSFYYYWFQSYMLWNQWKLLYGDLCSIFGMCGSSYLISEREKWQCFVNWKMLWKCATL